ncbi:MAG: hypothetical protein EOR99_23210 [Mesorhizobium sp.]|nr:MAG: hypothetical protein EOR99_23210 [Mesorhizobium sp.]
MFRIVWMKDVTALVNEHPGKRFFLPEAVMVAPLRRPQANFMRPTFVWWAGDVRWGKAVSRKQRSVFWIALFASVLGFVLLVLVLQIVSLLD